MCSKLLSFLVSVLLCRNVLLYFWATVSAVVCLVCSSTVVRNYDDDDDVYTVQSPGVYLGVWIAVDALSALIVLLFWIIQRYVCTLYRCPSSAFCGYLFRKFTVLYADI